MPGIAHFNDSLRDASKGSVFEETDAGFINGKIGTEELMMQNIKGTLGLDKSLGNYSSPNQVVQYLKAHDNLTLFDKLTFTNPTDDAETRRLRQLLGTSIPLLSQGMPFIHAGQEFMRTKDGDENSYKSPDSVNQIDWSRPYTYESNVDFIKELIALRKREPLFRLSSFDDIKKDMSTIETSEQFIAYQLKDDKNDYIVVLNSSDSSKKLSDKNIKLDDYDLVLTSNPSQAKASKTIEFPRISATILKKKTVSDEATKVNKDKLEKVITKADEIKDLSKYTDASKKAFEDARKKAKEVLDNEKATQEEVDKVTKDLQAAIDGLVAKTTNPSTDKTNKDKLKELVKKSKDIKDLSKYTDDSKKAFEDARKKAEQVLANDNATQKEVDDTFKNLEQAMKNLKNKKDGKPGKGSKGNFWHNFLPSTGEQVAGSLGIIGLLTLAIAGGLIFTKRKKEKDDDKDKNDK